VERAVCGDPADTTDVDPLIRVFANKKGTTVRALIDEARGRIYPIILEELAPTWREFAAGDLVPAVYELLRTARRAAEADAEVRPKLSSWSGGPDFGVHLLRAVLVLTSDGGNALLESYDPVSECAGREGGAVCTATGL
jgi:hypothetical protein